MLVFGVCLLWSSPVLGQSVVGTVVDATSNEPIPGAFVVLVDTTGAEAARTLTTGSGTFRLGATQPGTFRLRVERIGVADVTTEAFSIAGGQVVSRRVLVTLAPVRLADLQVQTTAQCTMLQEDAVELSRVWEEARKALKATVWTGQQTYYRFDGLLSRQSLDTDGNEVGQAEFESIRTYGPNPFASALPNDLAFGGWVQPARSGGLAFYGPDAKVLLSESFLRRHCFWLQRDVVAGSDVIGVYFEPLPTRRVTDISGVLWIDATSAELRSMEFTYEGLDLPFNTEMLGGEVEFDRLPDGAWIVRRFIIRTPLVSVRMRLVGLYEEGQSVTAIWRTADLQAGPAGALPEDVAPVNAPADELVVRYSAGN